MTARFLLDTNIVSAIMNAPAGPVVARIRQVGASSIAINPIIAGEIWYGVQRRGSARLAHVARGTLDRIECLPVPQESGHAYGEIRASLEHRGRSIGPNDLWIAAHAMVADLTLVTGNIGEFSRVDGLRVENWLE